MRETLLRRNGVQDSVLTADPDYTFTADFLPTGIQNHPNIAETKKPHYIPYTNTAVYTIKRGDRGKTGLLF